MADRATNRPDDGPACVFHIEELVLHGFKRTNRYAVTAAIERELGRLVSEPGAQRALLDRGNRGNEPLQSDAGSFVVPHDASPDAVGVQVARAIHRGLGAGVHADRRSSRAPPGPGGSR
jgi:hypothetical protein